MGMHQQCQIILLKCDNFWQAMWVAIWNTNLPYWCHGYDFTKRTKIKQGVKLMASIKIIAYDVSFAIFSDYFQMGEMTVRSKLVCRVVHNKKYFKFSTNEQMWYKESFKLTKKQHCIDGMVGFVDCMCVQWDNSPQLLYCQHIRKKEYLHCLKW